MHNRRKHRKRTRKHRMRGGKGVNMSANNFESVTNSSGQSGSTYVSGLVGDLTTQYNNALVGSGSGNVLVTGQRTTMSGGRRRRRRGGSFGPVVADAVVPLGLLALQQTYGKRSRKARRTRRRR
jgi:hypothetical protein